MIEVIFHFYREGKMKMSIEKKLKKIIEIINTDTASSKKKVQTADLLSALFFVCFIVTLATLVMNLIHHTYEVVITTSVLCFLSLTSFVFAFFFKKVKFSTFLFLIALEFICVYYYVCGINGGFSCLWSLLIPIFSMYLVGVKVGTFCSLLFLVLTFCFAYIPDLHKYMCETHHYYDHVFLTRFPILYFCDFAFSLIVMIQNQKRKVKLIKAKNKLKKQKKETEMLLLNILPKKIMDELMVNGYAEPEKFANVSIVFSDIVGFTNISKNMPPNILIEELNDICSHFDEIVEKNCCYRIKTMGDAYLAVCGLPERNDANAENILQCAKDFISYLRERNETADHKWNIRVGIHTGEVIAGIVGEKRYIYDVFGDAVNTASRMENCSESMRITVSQDFYNVLKDSHKFEKREPIDIKGKGLMVTYFSAD